MEFRLLKKSATVNGQNAYARQGRKQEVVSGWSPLRNVGRGPTARMRFIFRSLESW